LNDTDSRHSIARVSLEMKGRFGRSCFDSISMWCGIERIPVCSLSLACKTGPLIWARVTIFTGVRVGSSDSLLILPFQQLPPRQLVFQRGLARASARSFVSFSFSPLFCSTIPVCPSDVFVFLSYRIIEARVKIKLSKNFILNVPLEIINVKLLLLNY